MTKKFGTCLLEAVRDQTKCVDLKQVNRVLLQPHWRNDADFPPHRTPIVRKSFTLVLCQPLATPIVQHRQTEQLAKDEKSTF